MRIEELIERLELMLEVQKDNMEVKILINGKYVPLRNDYFAVGIEIEKIPGWEFGQNITLLKIEDEGDENDSI